MLFCTRGNISNIFTDMFSDFKTNYDPIGFEYYLPRYMSILVEEMSRYLMSIIVKMSGKG